MISFTSKTTWDETVQKIIYDTSNHSILQVTLLVTKIKKKINKYERKKEGKSNRIINDKYSFLSQ